MATRGIRVVNKKRGNRRSGSRKMGRLGELIFLAAFFVVGLVGLALVLWLVILPELRSARDFVETVCSILDKRVGESPQLVQVDSVVPPKEGDEGVSTENGQTYRPEILIAYEVDDHRYTTWTYDISGVYSRDRKSCQEILDDFEVGKTYACWYDPHHHKTAVLVRGFSWFGPLLALIPISFLMIGGGGLVYGLFYGGKSAERRAAIALRTQRRRERFLRQSGLASQGLEIMNFPSVPRGVDISNSPGNTLPFRLPVSVLPAWKLLGLLAACLIWNGIVATMLTIAVRSFFGTDPKWAMALFTLPFLACGIFLIVLLVKRFLIATGIGVTFLEVSAHPFVPGSRYQFLLHQAGRLKVNSLEAVLVCHEKTQYQQGTDTRTESQVVFEQTLFSKKNFGIEHQPFEAQESFDMPEGVMHSFAADSNEVSWSIEVRGNVARWPDFTRTFPVIVHPSHSPAATIRLEASTTTYKTTPQNLAALKRFG